MILERVPYAMLRPDPNNPREDFGDIEALAQSFMLNALYPGEPVNPPVVVRDGNVCRIVDGERRYQAMGINGITECNVIVCDDMDEANAMVAMVATDDKRQLTKVERSRGVQQMLMLGVDEEVAEKLGHLEAGQGAKVKRARKRVEGKADQLSLDHLVAIAEAEERGDTEAAEALMNAGEDSWSGRNWESVKRRFDELRAYEAGYETLRQACADLEVPFQESKPKKAVFEDTCYRLGKGGEEVRAWVQEQADKGFSIWCPVPTERRTFVTPESFSTPAMLTEEEAKTKSNQNQAKAAMTNAKKRRAQWVGERIANADALKHTLRFFVDGRRSMNARDFAAKAGIDCEDIPCPPSPFLLACDWPWTDDMTQAMLLAILFDKEDPCGGLGPRAKRDAADGFVNFMAALQGDGYIWNEHETELYAACCDILDDEEDA